MTDTISMPYDWLKQIPTALLQLDEIPLLGAAPAFPWEEVSKGMGEIFQIPDFKITHDPFQWRLPEELFRGLGGELTALTFVVPSLEGELTWVMNSEDVHRLLSLLLNEEHHEHDVIEKQFLDGFYYFAAYEMIHLVTKLPFGQPFSPQLQKESILPTEASLCADLKIQLHGQTLTGRLMISSALQRSWKEKHAERTMELPVKSVMAETLTLPVLLEVGKTAIAPTEWKSVSPGDFIVLDSCTINPDDINSGRVNLTVNGRPFFIGKIKDGNIKILDYPLYHQEEDINMVNHSPEDSSHDEESSFDFETDFDSEFESEMESEAEHSEAESHDEEHAEKKEEHIESKKEESHPEPSQEKHPEVVPAEAALKIDEIPLSVSIEVGRLQMSVKKLLELQPGHLLELNVRPEQGVDLVVNGKRIAKGELVKLGEALGVRILDIS